MSGTGPQATDSFELETGLVVLSAVHQAEGAFSVTLLDETGEMVDLPASAIGSFEGSSAVGVGSGTYLLDVDADGPWTVTVEQPRPAKALEIRSFEGEAPTATAPFSLPGGLVRFEMSHSGEGAFSVMLLDAEGNMLALPGSGVGRFDGSAAESVPGGIYVLEVDADGPWTVDIE